MSLSPALSGERDDPASRMDRMYRRQRHIYDLTRKFYLFGRDTLLDALPVAANSRVLEIGCGTGRNLIKLARRHQGGRYYGIDVSSEMLASAASAVAKHRLDGRITLAQSPGQGFDPRSSLGLDRFDIVYFSYVLSMIPDWRSAVETALSLVKPGGVLAIVDFGDQQKSPAWQRRLLLSWLRLFDVHPRFEIEASLVKIARTQGKLISHHQIFGGYAYTVLMRKAS